MVVFLTENYGKKTAFVPGAIHSKRFGPSFELFSCSRLEWFEKENQEVVRIQSAQVHYQFEQLPKDYERFTVAAFITEFVLKFIEPQTNVREFFVLMSRLLFHLNQDLSAVLGCAVFLAKSLNLLGSAPQLSHCKVCAKEVAEKIDLQEKQLIFDGALGGVLCLDCRAQYSLSVFHVEVRAISCKVYQALLKATVQSATQHQNQFPADLLKEAILIALTVWRAQLPHPPDAQMKSWKQLMPIIT